MSDDTFGKLCALLAAVAWAIGVPLLRRGARDIHPIVSCLIRNITGGLFLCLLVVLFRVDVAGAFAEVSLSRHLYFIASGLLGIAAADTFFFVGANRLQIGIIGLTQTVYSPLVVLLSAVVLHERLTPLQLAGGMLVITSTVLMKVSMIGGGESRAETKGLVFMILCVLANVAAVLLIKAAIQDFPLFLLLAYRMAVGVTPLLVWLLASRRTELRAELFNLSVWRGLFPGALVGSVLSTSLWVTGFAYTKASLAALLNESSSLFLLLIGWIVYRESMNMSKVASATLATAGLCLLWL